LAGRLIVISVAHTHERRHRIAALSYIVPVASLPRSATSIAFRRAQTAKQAHSSQHQFDH